MRMAILGLIFVFWPILSCGQDTGWLNPSANYGDFRNPERAYYDDGLWARGYPEQIHLYWGYPIKLPPSGEVLGIEVRLDAWRWPGGVPFAATIAVRLSWDGGGNWTREGVAGPLTASEQPWIVGGPTDTWGRSWTAAELSPESFRVHLLIRAERRPEVRLDWVAVRIYYKTAIALTISPEKVDLGTLTLADYDRAYRDWPDLQAVNLTSPGPWVLYIAALSPTWTYTGDLPDPKKPCEHLLWRVASASGPVTGSQADYLPLAVTEREVARGSAGTAELRLAFRLVVDYDTTLPGTYTLDFRYTLVVP